MRNKNSTPKPNFTKSWRDYRLDNLYEDTRSSDSITKNYIVEVSCTAEQFERVLNYINKLKIEAKNESMSHPGREEIQIVQTTVRSKRVK